MAQQIGSICQGVDKNASRRARPAENTGVNPATSAGLKQWQDGRGVWGKTVPMYTRRTHPNPLLCSDQVRFLPHCQFPDNKEIEIHTALISVYIITGSSLRNSGRTYAIGSLNVISSEKRSEKSLNRRLASGLFRDFSSQAPRPRKERWSKQ